MLSLCPALLTGIRLYEAIPESEIKTEFLTKIRTGIEVFFKFIYRDQDWRNNSNLKPVFDASPYESDVFYPGDDKEKYGRSYIDSISWATPLFLKIMNFVEKDEKGVDKKDKDGNPVFVFEEKYRDIARNLAKWCLKYVNNSILTIEKEDTESKEDNKIYQRPVGWSFSKVKLYNPEKQKSLYFTYAAASMYLTFYNEYRDIIDNLMTLNRKYDELNKKGDNEKPIFPLMPNYHTHNFKPAEEAIKAFERAMNKNDDEHKDALKL